MYYKELYDRLPDDLCRCVIMFAGDIYRAYQRDYLRQVYVNNYKTIFGRRFVFKYVLQEPHTLDYYIALSMDLHTPQQMKPFRIVRHRKPFLRDIERLRLDKQLDIMLQKCALFRGHHWWNCLVRSPDNFNAYTVYMA